MHKYKVLLGLCLLATTALTTRAQLVETHSFTNLNRAIPDGSAVGLRDTRPVTSAVTQITGVRVKLKIAGEFNGDLYGYLRHGSGLTVLLNRPGRSAGNDAGYDDAGFDVTFSDAATNDVHVYQSVTNTGGNALLGEWKPDGRGSDPASVLDTDARTNLLAQFLGQNAGGEWTLFLADLESGGTNQLVGWELEVTGQNRSPIVWATPADIVYGTALGVAQLNATTAPAGTFTYSPPAGTVLHAGNAQVLSVTFTPDDPAAYLGATTNVLINVQQAPLTITADDKTNIFGAPLPAYTASYSGFKLTDTPASLTTPVSLTSAATQSSPVGTYAIVPAAAASPNYTVSFVDGSLYIIGAQSSALLVSSANPALPGATVTFTFTLTPVAPSTATPGGTVTFKTNGVIAAAAAAINGGGAATFSTADLPHGLHTITAEYAGDGNFSGTTNSLTQNINSPVIANTDTLERYPLNTVKVRKSALLANDTDADNDPLTFVSVSGTSTNLGTITVSGQWITYHPPAGYTGVDAFTYVVTDSRGSTNTGTVIVAVKPAAELAAQNLAIENLGNGSFRIRGAGVPGYAYRVEYTTDLNTPVWQQSGSPVTADSLGVIELIDTPAEGEPQRFYRAVWP